MHYQYIENEQQLNAYCEKISGSHVLALDTEFVRTRTLYPQLGLIQIYDGQHLALIDPLNIDDFSSLNALLVDQAITKVLHSCSEDIETFSHNLGIVPSPIFDTQFASCVLGKGATLGYAALVEQMLGISVDKGESRTDWLARPLTERQCEYAANDVLYLWQIFAALRQACVLAERYDWVTAEIAALANKKSALLPTEYTYLAVKNNWKLHGSALYLLKKLAEWRIKKARELDCALNFVVREQAMVEIAKRKPNNKGGLFSIPGLAPPEIRKYGDVLLAMVNEIADVPPELYPPKIERLVNYPAYKQTMNAVRQICIGHSERLGIPLEVLGSKKQINQLLKWLWFDLDETRLTGMTPDLISGWRRPILINELEQLLGSNLGEK